MSYQVLARKWRPRSFDQLVGQPHVVRALSNSLRDQRLHHAYLFTGTRGVGKTTIARVLAKCLNCETGITESPCGECTACREIDAGRFVDLIEVDAASRTGVDDTRELLENVPYAPTRGRFKIYLVDEVHMLSNHSFNALLKTLEEPPPHVKFMLATTDRQKLPVTILSRCLQFNLKAMPVQTISQHLRHVLEQEDIAHEPPALAHLARAAAGSMRDALSLLDQAIAFGGGEVCEADVLDMLGAISRDHLRRMLEALADGNGPELLAAVDDLSTQAPDYAGVLADLVSLLHQLAVAQQVPEALDSLPEERGMLEHLAQRLDPADVQLFYQIALVGRADLPLAPDPRSGLEMLLLRMLAFRPVTQAASAVGPGATRGKAGGAAPAGYPAAQPPAQGSSGSRGGVAEPGRAQAPAAPAAGGSAEFDWPSLVATLGLPGMAGQLASHCALRQHTPDGIILSLAPQHEGLRTANAQGRLEAALKAHLGHELALKIEIGETQAVTPVALDSERRAQRQASAERSVAEDPLTRALAESFDARIVPGSVRPLDAS